MLEACKSCPYLVVQAVPSIQGDGYGTSYEYCDPPMGECPLDRPETIEEVPYVTKDT